MSYDDFYKDLCTKYGKIFYDKPHIECPEGWYEIVTELTEELYNASKEFVEGSVKVSYIKEKFGGLRYYIDYDLPDEQVFELEQIVRKWEKFSYKICIICGTEEGVKPVKKHWESPICYKCLEEHHGK